MHMNNYFHQQDRTVSLILTLIFGIALTVIISFLIAEKAENARLNNYLNNIHDDYVSAVEDNQNLRNKIYELSLSNQLKN